MYKFSIDLSLSSKGQNKYKLQKHISNILISTETAAWCNYRNDVRWCCNTGMHNLSLNHVRCRKVFPVLLLCSIFTSPARWLGLHGDEHVSWWRRSAWPVSSGRGCCRAVDAWRQHLATGRQTSEARRRRELLQHQRSVASTVRSGSVCNNW